MHLDLEVEAVAGDDRPAELRLVDAEEVQEARRLVEGSLAYARMPPICASASMTSTPGMIGFFGKCPRNQGSFMLTHLCPRMRSFGTTSVTRSTITNGQRCGRIWRMRSMSSSVRWLIGYRLAGARARDRRRAAGSSGALDGRSRARTDAGGALPRAREAIELGEAAQPALALDGGIARDRRARRRRRR